MKIKNKTTKILIIVLVAGLSLLLYPSVSDYWNSFHQSQAIAKYAGDVADLDDERYLEILQSARLYNEMLCNKKNHYHQTEEELDEYNSQLDISHNGIMGYIDIPKINCELPIYHGVEESVLQIAIGHVEWSSLPVGGKGSHVVVSGHRGLPSARLFTDLNKLVEGDIFKVQVLNETLTYEVDQIRSVTPQEIDVLGIEEDMDLFTLVTCTPYGINTERLLVRGHRIENENDRTIRVVSDAMLVESTIVAIVVATPMLLVLLIIMLITTRRRR